MFSIFDGKNAEVREGSKDSFNHLLFNGSIMAPLKLFFLKNMHMSQFFGMHVYEGYICSPRQKCTLFEFVGRTVTCVLSHQFCSSLLDHLQHLHSHTCCNISPPFLALLYSQNP